MGLNKFSKQDDRVANLYRAALYLAKGDKTTSLKFLKNSGSALIGKISACSPSENRVWAEKILDEYHAFLT